MAKGTVQKRPLTNEEMAECARLKVAWENYKAQFPGATQKWLGEVTKLGNQSLMGQYLTGKIPLNDTAILRICKAIGGYDPIIIRPSMALPVAATLSAQARELIRYFDRATPDAQDRILRYAIFEAGA